MRYSYELSQLIADKYSHLMEEHQCYEHVYRLVTSDEVKEFRPKEKVSIVFCYFLVGNKHYYRHVFCLYDDYIIEPLLYLDINTDNINDEGKIIVIRHMPLSEYLDLVEKDESALRKALVKDDIRVVQENDILKYMNIYDNARLQFDAAYYLEENQ